MALGLNSPNRQARSEGQVGGNQRRWTIMRGGCRGRARGWEVPSMGDGGSQHPSAAPTVLESVLSVDAHARSRGLGRSPRVARTHIDNAVETGFAEWRSRGVPAARNWVTRRSSGTRDYRHRLPRWAYVLSCGHSTALSRRLAHDARTGPLDGWAWCAECARWQRVNDSPTVEVAPTARRLVRHMKDGRVLRCPAAPLHRGRGGAA